jgi:hypothetical protein
LNAYFLSRPRVLTLETDGNGKKTTKKPDKGKGGQKSQPPASNGKGKRKAPPDEDGTDTIDSEHNMATKPTKSKTGKNQSTTAKESRPTTDVDVDPDDAAGPKKKKMRKLNIFASSKSDSLDWANQFNLVSRVTVGSCVAVTSMSLFREVVVWIYQLSFRH